MIYRESQVEIVDNSGATKGLCIQLLGGTNKQYATVGDTIVLAVKKAKPDGEVKRGDVCRAVIVGTQKNIRRPNGSYLRFNKNMVVIINDKNELRGTRVFAPVARELREKFPKVVSLAPETV